MTSTRVFSSTMRFKLLFRPYVTPVSANDVVCDNVTGDDTLPVAYRLAQGPSGGHLMNPYPVPCTVDCGDLEP